MLCLQPDAMQQAEYQHAFLPDSVYQPLPILSWRSHHQCFETERLTNRPIAE